MKNRSLGINAVLYVIRNIMRIIFPLITFPYISRVLGVDNIGRFNFASSIITYFLLIAEFGIPTYAVREGARIRNDRERFTLYLNEIFTINIISGLVSYLLLILLLLSNNNLKSEALLIIILSSKVMFATIGIEWVYSVYEDFFYITARSITMQLVSLILMFVFVKSSEDLLVYAGVSVTASVGSNIFNLIHSRKYCHLRMTRKMNLERHLRPIIIIFITNIGISIYCTSDMTLLGIFCGSHATGLYAVAANVYNIAKSTLAAIILVSIPRLSAMLGNNEFERYKDTAGRIYKCLLSIAFPAMIGIMLLSKDVVILISGDEFVEATSALMILCLAAIVDLGVWFYSQCVLIPLKKEKIMLIMAVTTALLNIGLNVFLIPLGAQNAAAITTLISEIVAYLIVWLYSTKYVRIRYIKKTLLKTFIGCIVMGIGVYFVKKQTFGLYYEIFLSIMIGAVLYFCTEFALGNKEIISIVNGSVQKIKRVYISLLNKN